MSILRNIIANNKKYSLQANRLVIAPKAITNTAMMTYMLAMIGCLIAYSSHMMPVKWWIFGLVSVFVFFVFANRQTNLWKNTRPNNFIKKLFWSSFALRLLWVLISYWLYCEWTGNPFSIGALDEWFYHEVGLHGANLMREGNFSLYQSISETGNIAFSDMGYPIYLSIIYWMFGDSILIARIIKAILSAWTVVLVYKVASRNFGESTGRMAGIFCMLMPNLIYYCSFQLKEVEMVFLAMLFIELADNLLRNGKLTLLPTAALMLILLYLFMIRTALAATLVLAFFSALLFMTGRVVGWGKRIMVSMVAGIFVIIMFLTSSGIGQEVKVMWERRGSGQQANMEWRSVRDVGKGMTQKFAKYAGAAVFAPMIFTIPFPTMTEIPQQENQMMIHGGNFVKNITSYFTIMALFVLLFSGKWRKHVLPMAVLCGYLVVLVFSSFAQSERFHLPILPLSLMFAAYGISVMNQYPWIKKYFRYWCVLMFIAAVAWNWFKLAGRGMI